MRIFIVRIRKFLSSFTFVEKGVFALVFVIICLRVIFPIWHTRDGYPIYLYPFRESAICLVRYIDCQVDRSRTFNSVASTVFITTAWLIVRRTKKFSGK